MPYQYDGPTTYDDPLVGYDGVSMRAPIRQPCYITRRRARTWTAGSVARVYACSRLRRRSFSVRRVCRAGERSIQESHVTHWPAKDPAEEIVATFDFSPELDGETISGAVCACEVESGTDPAPEQVLEGACTISGGSVLQRLIAGVAGVSYNVRCTVTLAPTARVLVLAAVLPVRRAG